MARLFFHPFSLIAILAVVFGAVLAALLPQRYASDVKTVIENQSRYHLEISGGSGFTLAPVMGVALYDVSISSPAALTEPLIHIDRLVVPLDRKEASPLYLEGADLDLVFDAQGHANLKAVPSQNAAKSEINGDQPRPFTFKVINGSMEYHNARSGAHFAISHIAGDLVILNDGSSTAQGSAVIKSQPIKFTSSLSSLSRLVEEGSPIDLNIQGAETSFAFSGRADTQNGLSLAGRADVQTQNLPQLLTWIGMPIAGISGTKNFAITGALLSYDADFNLKNSEFSLATMKGKGDVSYSATGVRPKITASVGLDHLDLNAYQAVGGPAASQHWNEAPFKLDDLRVIDANLKINTQKIEYSSLETGPTSVQATLKDRTLHVDLKGYSGSAVLDFNAAVEKPKLTFDLELKRMEAQSLLGQQKIIAGPVTLSAHLAGTGISQAEIISTLSGVLSGKLEAGKIFGAQLNEIAATSPAGWGGGSTDGVTAAAHLDISEGVATVSQANIDTPLRSLKLEGEVDILRQAFNLRIASLKMKMDGLWRQPRFAPDDGGLLKTLKKLNSN
jgi:AsmA-like C-terminal region